jgi:diacylglycerol kinase family enzyme
MPQEIIHQPLRHVAVVMNARAGALLAAGDVGEALPRLFAEAGIAAEIIDHDAGTLAERIAAALATGPDALVVAGGDGTVACAAQLMVGRTDIPLGIVPAGTVNLLAKDLALPIGDPAAAIAALARGRVRTIDAGEVNGHVFLCAVMLGLPVHLGRHREHLRGARAKSLRGLPAATLRHLIRPNPLRGALTVGGHTVRIKAAAATVTVNPMEEATGLRFARQCLDGGTLTFYELRARNILGWVRFVARVLTRSWRRDAGLHEWSAPRMTLEPGAKLALHVMVDGEIRLLSPPLALTCHPKSIRVLVG